MKLIHVIKGAFQAAQTGMAILLKELLKSYPSMTHVDIKRKNLMNNPR